MARLLTKQEVEFINAEVESFVNIYYDTNEPVGTKQQVLEAAYWSVMENNEQNKQITFSGSQNILEAIAYYIDKECPKEMFK
jgi:hypothetical protein